MAGAVPLRNQKTDDTRATDSALPCLIWRTRLQIQGPWTTHCDMECVVLGNGGMMPMPLRLTTSVLVRRGGRMLMLDAGEGIQIALKRGGLGIASLDAVLVSHLHADHVLGLPGIMMFRAQNDHPDPLTIIGPPGLRRFVEVTIDALGCYINYPYTIIEWGEETGNRTWQWGEVTVEAFTLAHSVFCMGYRLDEGPRPGRFNVERATSLGIPPGPLYGELQHGRSVVLANGNIILPEHVLGPPRPGRSVAYATDTRPCPGLSSLLSGVDLALTEGMYAREHQQDAEEKKHMTAEEAAIAASSAQVKRLILVHISPRYSKTQEHELATQAKRHFPAAEISVELRKYPVPLSP